MRVGTIPGETEHDMIDTLHNLMETLAHLPEAYQQEAVRRIQPIVEELDDRAWDEGFADTRSDTFFAEAEAELERERAAGTLIPLEDMLGKEE
jgi:hypothetical protein